MKIASNCHIIITFEKPEAGIFPEVTDHHHSLGKVPSFTKFLGKSIRLQGGIGSREKSKCCYYKTPIKSMIKSMITIYESFK